MITFGNWGGLPQYLSAREAAARLGVSRRTLYVYVSRPLVRSVGEHHNKRYCEADIAQLLSRKKAARKPSVAAHGALDWGLPVLDSAITCIDKGGVFYRGMDVTALAAHATVEEVARVLWDCGDVDPFAAAASLVPGRAGSDGDAMQRCTEGLACVLARPSQQVSPLVEAARLIRHFYAAAVGVGASKRRLDRVLAAGFARPKEADVFRRALILCADHELSASAFAVRCAASTGAPLAAALLAGVGAFAGAAQGGAPEEVEKLLDDCLERKSAERAIAVRLRDADSFPGFGHKLHPLGDCRASALLAVIAQTAETKALEAAMAREVGLKPNIAFALVALRRALDLPRGAARTIYACGRSLGWVAHALEQASSGELIRPRARYVGPAPAPIAGSA